MRKRQRFAFLAIGGLGLLAAIAPGLAAGIQTPSSMSSPAAGQGVVEVQGFEVDEINWVIDEDTERVTTVTFKIERESGGAVTAGKDTGNNAVVRVRLESGSDAAAWQDCVVDAGDAECTLATSDTAATAAPGIHGAQMFAASLDQVNIIAFDSN
jgi:hypothetical protein